uniref:Kelch-like family member 33 n=1 Tax=Sander lucioperca TaxID=283035 RepID=A0A8C9X713_SANLU
MAVEVNQCLLGWDEWRREVLERRERVSLFEREVIENGELGEIKDEARAVDPDEKLRGNENSILGPSTSKERKEEEDESKKLTNEKEAAASRTTQEEEFQDHHKKFQKKKPTDDDEEAEHAMDEEADSNDEDVVKIYCKGDYHTDIFRNLAEFRDSFLLTDLTLSTEDRGSFHVHSPVLAAVSSHIREGLSRCNVGNDTVDERKDTSVGVHRWSVSLGPEVDNYQPALSLCLNFLHQEINPHSCLDLASFAEAYEMVQLLEVADDYFLRQFQKVACTSKFKDLPVKQLLKYLNSRSLCVPSEFVLFKAVVAWIQAKPKLRLKFAEELMKTIHFSLMTSKEFKEVQSLKMWSDHSLAKLYKAVFEDFCSNESQCRTYLPKESLVLIGGDQNSEDSRSISRELWFGNSLRNYKMEERDMEWRKLGEMPEPERFCHEVAVLKGQLYVFGGKNFVDQLACEVYNPVADSWTAFTPLPVPHIGAGGAVLEGKFYVLGGYSQENYRDTKMVHCYDPTTQSWQNMGKMPGPNNDIRATVLYLPPQFRFVKAQCNALSLMIYRRKTRKPLKVVCPFKLTNTLPLSHSSMYTLSPAANCRTTVLLLLSELSAKGLS